MKTIFDYFNQPSILSILYTFNISIKSFESYQVTVEDSHSPFSKHWDRGKVKLHHGKSCRGPFHFLVNDDFVRTHNFDSDLFRVRKQRCIKFSLSMAEDFDMFF